MGTALLTWELGGGWGHFANLLPFARGLTSQGHRLFVATRDVSRAEVAFRGLEKKRGQVQLLTCEPVAVGYGNASNSARSTGRNGLPCHQLWRGQATIVFQRR